MSLAAIVLASAALVGAGGGADGHGGHGAAPASGDHGAAPAATGHGAARGVTRPVVRMRDRAFSPQRLTLLAGETISWENDDGRNHDVAAGSGLFDSGRLTPGGRFEHTFDRQGRYAYKCTLHPFMFGEVEVFGLALSGPSRSLAPGGSGELTGRAPAGTDAVAIEAAGPDGAFATVASVKPDADGAYKAEVAPERSLTYRARASELSSRPVRVLVGARLSIRAVRRGHMIHVTAAATPAQPGAPAVLQRYDRERFDWRPVARARFGRDSRATFVHHAERSERLRVVEPRGVNGFGAAASPSVRVR